ncbi:EMC9 protein, partial [Polypterus senegalus]
MWHLVPWPTCQVLVPAYGKIIPDGGSLESWERESFHRIGWPSTVSAVEWPNGGGSLMDEVYRTINKSKSYYIDSWCSQRQRKILGYYQANAALTNTSPDQVALKIVDKISEQCQNAVLVMVDNSKVDSGIPPVLLYEKKDSKWILKDKNLIMWRQWEETKRVANALLESKAYRQLVDFDTHLDDIRQDWTNQHINAKIEELLYPANGTI